MMSLKTLQDLLRDHPLKITVVAAIIMIIAPAISASFDLWEEFAKRGNDDVMRLLMVRDLIAGQGWFDVVQYRVLPPEGMPLHWSRYIDAGIAAIILPLSFLVPMPVAELLGAMIWPTLIQLIALAVITFGTRRLFGTYAACFAVLCLVLWPVTANWQSGPGNIDHHNVQMLMTTLIVLGAIWPDRPLITGLVSGLAGAFSLAIGLEAFPFILAAGIVFLSRSLLICDGAARIVLCAFCFFLAIGSALFWLGQTAPALRAEPMCDRLSTPILSVIWAAAVASTAPLLLRRWLSAPLLHLVFTGLLTSVGIILAWPLLAPCLAGPYGNLSAEMQDFISTAVGEALPGWHYFQQYPVTSVVFFLPPLLAPILLFGILFNDWRSDEMTIPQRTALVGLGFFCVIGFVMVLYQMRAVALAAAIVPVLTGFVLFRLLTAYLQTRNASVALGGLCVATALISPSTVASMMATAMPELPEPQGTVGNCRTYTATLALNEVPPGLILNHFNVAPHVLWLTHHDVLSAGYHTSAAALENAVLPFGMDEASLQEYIRNSGATHFSLCANTTYSSDFVTALAAGEAVDWLRPVLLSDENQVLLEVVQE